MEENKKKHPMVVCHVQDCVHHMHKAEACSLDTVVIGAQKQHPAVPEGTECASFAPEKGRTGPEH